MKIQSHTFTDNEGKPIGYVFHKVPHRGYTFSLWYNAEGKLTNLEKYKNHWNYPVRIGKSDKTHFANMNYIVPCPNISSWHYSLLNK